MNRLFGKRLTALLLTLVMVVGMVPAVSAASSADISLEVYYDEKVELKRAQFRTYLRTEAEDNSLDLAYVEITDIDSDFDDYGYFIVNDIDGKATELTTASEVETYYYYSEEMFEDYSGDEDDEFLLSSFYFVANEDAEDGTFTIDFLVHDFDYDEEYEGVLEITVVGEEEDKDLSDFDKDDYDLVYSVDPDESVEIKRKALKDLFDKKKDESLYYMEITDIDADFDDYGYFTVYDYYEDACDLDTVAEVETPLYFYDADAMDDLGDPAEDYLLNDMTFYADEEADDGYFVIEFTLWNEYEDESYDGEMAIVIGDLDSDEDDDDEDTITADITFSVDPDDEVELKRSSFKDLFEEEYEDFYYLTFDKITNMDGNGYVTAIDYDEEDATLDDDDLKDGKFYYSSSDLEDEDTDYELDDLYFVADEDADGEVVMMEFTLYGEDTSDQLEGILLIQIGNVKTSVPGSTGSSSAQTSLRYSITGGTAWQVNVNDIERLFKASYPGSKLQYVKLMNAPGTGGLYYDYYNTSGRVQMSATNCNTMFFYREPYGNQYDLGKLTYIPSGSNYCTTIVFIAYGTGSQQVIGSLNIGVTSKAISEVYAPIPKNTSVSFPAAAIYNAVYNATGKAMASIKLLQVPTSNIGVVTASTGYYSYAANTSTNYTYASGTSSIGALKFTPAVNYTGSVEIPYMAYDASGNAIAMGKFCLGVVNSVKRFSDVSSSTWCYKYVTELSDASVIGGYTDGTFKPNNTITYGAALKLVTLAAGHGEKAPTGSHTFSGYLTYAQQKGWVSGNVNLSGNITRLQIAQLAAKAMGLNVSNLSSNRPFTDTADVYVQALNAAGIIEGYFNNGSYAYRPSNTLTRGQVSAIVWRMRNYNG